MTNICNLLIKAKATIVGCSLLYWRLSTVFLFLLTLNNGLHVEQLSIMNLP